MRFGRSVDWHVQRVLLADRLHWTLDVIDNLPDEDLAAVTGVLDGRDKAFADIQKRGR